MDDLNEWNSDGRKDIEVVIGWNRVQILCRIAMKKKKGNRAECSRGGDCENKLLTFSMFCGDNVLKLPLTYIFRKGQSQLTRYQYK